MKMTFLIFLMRTTLLMSLAIALPGCTSKHSSIDKQNETMTDLKQIEGSPVQMKENGYASINGISMYYEIYGDGKPLVLIHGGGSTIQTSFGQLIPNLPPTRRIIAMELQAHGHTSDRAEDLSFEQDASDVAALLQTLNVTNADILGFSNGGTTALLLAARHPELVERVVAASFLLKRDGAPPQFWDFMKQATLDHMPDAYKQAAMSIHGDSSRLRNMHDKCARRMIEFEDIANEDLQSIKAPVLLVNGSTDVATSDHVIQISKLIPDCQIAIIPGGHGEYLGEVTTLQPGSKPKLEILPILEKFLAAE